MRARGALVHECHELGSRHVTALQAVDLEPGPRKEGLDRSIEMTATAHPGPKRIETILPLPHTGPRSQSRGPAKSSRPLGLRTRRISSSARRISGIVHIVQVETTVSTLWSSSGMRSAEASRKLSGRSRSADFCCAMPINLCKREAVTHGSGAALR